MDISRKLWKQHREIIYRFGVDIGLPTRKLLGAPSIVSPYVVGRCRPEAGGLLAMKQWPDRTCSINGMFFMGKKKPKNGKIMENPLSMMDFRWDFLMDFSIATLDSAD